MICAMALVNPGEVAWIEDPGFYQARRVFGFAGATVVPRPVDREGIVIGRPSKQPNPKIIYVTPSHQFPLGMTMSLARRRALIDFAHARDAYIFEDDHNSEFRFTGPPLPCLQGLDDCGRVIYAGTMSKILYPSLRLGYILAPQHLVEPLIKIRAVMDQHSPAIDQATLARFMAEGYFLSHIKRMRKLYSDRREFFIEQFNKLLGRYFTLQIPEAGLHFVAWLRRKEDLPKITRVCAEIGIRPSPLSSCFMRPEAGSRAHLRLRGLDARANSRGPAQIRGCARGGEVEAAEFRRRGRPLLSGLVQNRKVAISGIRQGSDHGCNTNKGVNQS